MTSQQMHAEFRPRRYAWGTFTIIPTNSIREPDLRNQTTRARYCQHLNYEPKLDGWPTISHITPYPENAKRRRKDAVKAPLLSFKRIDVGIWSEIREIKLDLEFSYYNDWKKVRRELAFLARMLKKRVFPLRTLYLTMTWEIAGDTGVRDIKKYNEKTSFDDNWRDIVEPLKKMTWTENVARRVQFHVKEKGRWSSGSRGYRSESVEQFLKGMTAASEEGRLDVVENGLLRYH
ncbi:uncharacterized protein BDR25DRAFT_300834 [Lindgomyces ingoldianus]|uniref:Uncharacterized protein n=1 Tax=Lindgomyces ingoldianus TaxID=673940 RepID=A0ACB6RA06_9PLEO|nr:uncharacterized protein BDR25DRAFT_300834 [Lindgomyces ingoldianus]KAF2475976.1 hypothetical protein BDR25DRAFT_300834 [Lindgomyces ingoldianus]